MLNKSKKNGFIHYDRSMVNFNKKIRTPRSLKMYQIVQTKSADRYKIFHITRKQRQTAFLRATL